jgi:4-deoxy-L-threo-5-hexosulose-uronate ketol-isomerase
MNIILKSRFLCKNECNRNLFYPNVAPDIYFRGNLNLINSYILSNRLHIYKAFLNSASCGENIFVKQIFLAYSRRSFELLHRISIFYYIAQPITHFFAQAMATSSRYAIHPEDFKSYNTGKIREAFLISDLFRQDEITHHYTHYDRLIVGGISAQTKTLSLDVIPELKASYYLERREMGVINVGDPALISVDGKEHELQYKDALYIGKESKQVLFHPASSGNSRLYFNSAPAHRVYPVKKVSLNEADSVDTGAVESSNQRTIRKLLINSVLPTCQLQLGLTELKSGSVWNTMPPHTHDRRMEAYFYFEIPDKQAVCHFLGKPEETRHIWIKNNEAVLSPPWSIHCGAGTCNYSFIWGMAGENLDYSDMDIVTPDHLK